MPSAPAARTAERKSSPDHELAWRSINAIRVLSMDAVEAAQSGHPGTPMALAPAAYVLWHRFLRHNPRNPEWPDRDRFVLSCGHASMLIYSLLHLSGYDLPIEEIRAFRQWGSKTPGHPERLHTPGVETTTGPLGQGVGNAVGMAIAERLLADLARPMQVGGRSIEPEGSVGIAFAADGRDTADALLRDADAAMYAAKRTGKGRYVSAVSSSLLDP